MRKSSLPVICAASLLPASVGELNAMSLNDRIVPKMKWLRSVDIIFDAIPKRRQVGATQILDMPHLKVKFWIYQSVHFGCSVVRSITLPDTWQSSNNPVHLCECNDVLAVVVAPRIRQRFDCVQFQDRPMSWAAVRSLRTQDRDQPLPIRLWCDFSLICCRFRTRKWCVHWYPIQVFRTPNVRPSIPAKIEIDYITFCCWINWKTITLNANTSTELWYFKCNNSSSGSWTLYVIPHWAHCFIPNSFWPASIWYCSLPIGFHLFAASIAFVVVFAMWVYKSRIGCGSWKLFRNIGNNDESSATVAIVCADAQSDEKYSKSE